MSSTAKRKAFPLRNVRKKTHNEPPKKEKAQNERMMRHGK